MQFDWFMPTKAAVPREDWLTVGARRLPLRLVKRRVATAAEGIPNGSVKVVLSDGSSQLAATPEALRDALLPSAANQ